jgi:hypothetical protein
MKKSNFQSKVYLIESDKLKKVITLFLDNYIDYKVYGDDDEVSVGPNEYYSIFLWHKDGNHLLIDIDLIESVCKTFSLKTNTDAKRYIYKWFKNKFNYPVDSVLTLDW